MFQATVSLFSNWLGGLDERWQAVLTFVVNVTFVAIVALAKPIAFSIPLLRALISPDDRYAGHYLQIINSGTERRYSLIKVAYKTKLNGYLLRGFQYDEKGRRVTDFDSDNFVIRKGTIEYIEFVWRSVNLADKERFDGYTQMRPDDTDDFNYLAGRGFFITFHRTPIRFDLRFVKLTEERLKKFKQTIPRTEADRANFIVDLHKQLKDAPYLQPIEEADKPLV